MSLVSNDHFTQLIFWLPGVCAMLHITEEFIWPGKFLAWYRDYRPQIAVSITPRFAVVGNTILLAAAILLGVMGPTWSRGLSLWLILAALLAGNAVFHILGALHMWRYSPGVITSIFLYLPLCVWGFWFFLDNHEVSLEFAFVSFVIGASYQFWSMRIHRGLSGMHKSTQH